MRMWMVPVENMCRKHLLGEHVELHMFVGSMNKGLSMQGFLRNNLMQPASLLERHDVVAREMANRGYSHKSPLPAFELSQLDAADLETKVDTNRSVADLRARCPECNQLFSKGEHFAS